MVVRTVEPLTRQIRIRLPRCFGGVSEEVNCNQIKVILDLLEAAKTKTVCKIQQNFEKSTWILSLLTSPLFKNSRPSSWPIC